MVVEARDKAIARIMDMAGAGMQSSAMKRRDSRLQPHAGAKDLRQIRKALSKIKYSLTEEVVETRKAE